MSVKVQVNEDRVVNLCMDATTFHLLIMQTAASIIAAVKDMPTSGYPTTGIGGTIRTYTCWSPHGYVNALQTSVELLYNSIPEILKDKHIYDKCEFTVIKKALSDYQAFKNKLVAIEFTQRGIKDRSQFALMDWTDRNNLL